MKRSLIIIIFSLFLASCGYTVKNKFDRNNFKISEINLTGEAKINYKIKSRLIFADAENSKNALTVDIDTNKEKQIKNKNIKNEITGYYVTVTTKINYKFVGDLKENSFTIVERGDFKVSSNRLNTLKNEKNLIRILTDNTIEKIISRLNSSINDS